MYKRQIQLYCEEIGKPIAILSDNGSQFTSNRWSTALTDMGTKAKYTAIRNPNTNLAERINRKLGNMFRAMTSDKHTKWAQFLKLIEACINQTYQEILRPPLLKRNGGRNQSGTG